MSGPTGVFGGTFDPVHLGHLIAAEAAREALGLERVLFVPALRPPHKPDLPVTAPGHRVAMLRAAIADNPAFGLDTLELDRDGPSYSVDTLAALTEHAAASGSTADLVFICSTEALRGLPSWREPGRILSLARVAAVPRGLEPPPTRGWLEEHFGAQAPRILLIDGPRIEVSGTAIRERVTAGRSIRYLVPAPVAAYIADNGLYQPSHTRTDRS
jgi:nicotinate-nucleotide adenylyltransferase